MASGVRIAAVETLRLEEYPNLLWVRLHTDAGPVGLGETYFGAAAVEAHIHEFAAPRLVGADPMRANHLAAQLKDYLGARGAGAEARAASALDLALWDLKGKLLGSPVYDLIGGQFRHRVRAYNTCAGYRYIRKATQQQSANWGIGEAGAHGEGAEPYEDLEAFLTRADELAASLLEQGITAMKIWPFDTYAEQSSGLFISQSDMKKGLEPIRRIRAAHGERMDVMIEFHSLWNLTCALQIAQALEEYKPFWVEDPIRMSSMAALRTYASRTRIPVCASEMLSGVAEFRELIGSGAAGVVMLDLSWCGGLTEALRIASLAEDALLPVTPHDCTGPVVFAASSHFAVSVPNVLIQEMVRAFYFGWYAELVTQLPPLEDGYLRPPPGAGLGIELRPDVAKRPDATVRWTRA